MCIQGSFVELVMTRKQTLPRLDSFLPTKLATLPPNSVMFFLSFLLNKCISWFKITSAFLWLAWPLLAVWELENGTSPAEPPCFWCEKHQGLLCSCFHRGVQLVIWNQGCSDLCVCVHRHYRIDVILSKWGLRGRLLRRRNCTSCAISSSWFCFRLASSMHGVSAAPRCLRKHLPWEKLC